MELYDQTKECEVIFASILRHAREGKGPAFIECETYRLRGHAGPGSDAHLGYRSEMEIASWEDRCPIEKFRQTLLREGAATEEQIASMGDKMDIEIQRAFETAQSDPLPESSEATRFVYKE